MDRTDLDTPLPTFSYLTRERKRERDFYLAIFPTGVVSAFAVSGWRWRSGEPVVTLWTRKNVQSSRCVYERVETVEKERESGVLEEVMDPEISHSFELIVTRVGHVHFKSVGTPVYLV